MPHRQRAALAARHPVHVTVRLRAGLPNLRRRSAYAVLRGAFRAGCDRFGFRLVHYSVQSNHIHILAEARDRHSLSRGMQGLLVRIAKRLNKLWLRKGTVFADRYHGRILRTPREVRNALAYILNNALRHGLRLAGLDPFASGRWFDGWRERPPSRGLDLTVPPTAEARTWLLNVGWRRCRLISLGEVPGPRNNLR